MRARFQEPGVHVVASVPVAGPVPPPSMVVTPDTSAVSICCGEMKWMCVSTPPAVTIMPSADRTSVPAPIVRPEVTPSCTAGLPEALVLVVDPLERGVGHIDAERLHAPRGTLQGGEPLQGGVIGEVLGDVGELDGAALRCPGQRVIDFDALIEERQQLLVGQQDAVAHVCSQGVLDDRLPHAGGEWRVAGLVPHRRRGDAADPGGADEQPVGALLLQG